MAIDPADQTFEARFRTFYEGCSDEEQRFLELLVARAEAEDADVTGFAALSTPGGPGDRIVAVPSLQQLPQWSGLSNVMKTKHDTVKNSISNVR